MVVDKVKIIHSMNRQGEECHGLFNLPRFHPAKHGIIHRTENEDHRAEVVCLCTLVLQNPAVFD